MCGISGVVLSKNKLADDAMLTQMGQQMHHRGPDYFATRVVGNAGFAHNRLSILDLSETGNQPFYDDRYTLIYNGEIYNYLDLKKELVARGVAFRSTSDTEVLFQSLIHVGVAETLQRIKGMFAFAFYDKGEQTLYLCRDRLGIKPLYWMQHAGGLYFGSEIKAIAAAVPIEPEPIKTLYTLFVGGEYRRETSLFRGVQTLGAGTYLKYRTGGSPQITEYFSLVELVDPDYHQRLSRLKMADVEALFLTLLENSIKRRLMSDVPMGIFVSGGIDSSLIAAIAKQHGQDLKLFTANILGKFSEFDDAQHLAKSIDLPLYDYAFAPDMLVKGWAQATWHDEIPIIDKIEAIPFFNVAQLARQMDVKPVLTGEGADELFLGYPDAAFRRFEKWMRFPIHFLKKIYQTVPSIYRRFMYNQHHSQADFLVQMIGEAPEERAFRRRATGALGFLPPQQADLHYSTLQLLRTNIHALLHRNDRMGMIASIESRFPFLDEDLLRFGINLPIKWKLRWTPKLHDIKHPFIKDKFILRKGAEKYLPPQLTEKMKNPFPLYRLNYVKVKKGFFKDGYVSELMGLTRQATTNTLDENQPWFVGKLVSIEVFGRLFSRHQTQEDIAAHLQRYVSVKPD